MSENALKVERAYRTELEPTNVQRTAFRHHCDAARFAYNWGLQRKLEVWWMNQLPRPHIKTPSAIDLHRELNARKKTDLGWLYGSSKCAPQEALRNLDRAFVNFFEGRARFPRYHSRHRDTRSFRLTGIIRVEDGHLILPRLGRVKLKERGYLPTARHIRSVTISQKAERWYASLSVEEELPTPAGLTGEAVGVDLGIAALATVSDGTVIENPRALFRSLRKLKRLQRAVSRKQKGSKNREKAQRRVSRVQVKVTNVRLDALHKATTELARNRPVIVVEALRPANLLKNRNLAQSLADASFGKFIRQLEYKCEWNGSRLMKADPFYPSTKRCSGCGSLQEIPLSKRTYRCLTCGLVIDRDLNASRNLAMLAASSVESQNACGGRATTHKREPVPRSRNLPASVVHTEV